MIIRNEESIIVNNVVLRGELKEQFGEVVKIYIELDERNRALMAILEREHGRDFLDATFEEYMDDNKTLEAANEIRFIDLEEFVYALQNKIPYENIKYINSLHAVMHSIK